MTTLRLTPAETIDHGRGTGSRVVAALGLLVVSVLAAAVMQRYPPSWLVVLGGGLGLVLVLALAIARYEAAVALGVALLAVVAVEPAPPDGVFAVVMAVALVTGRFDLERAPLAITALSAFFLLLNVASTVEALDPARAAFFVSITLYLVVFAVWFTSYLSSEGRARGVVRAYLVGAVASAALASLALYVPFPGADLFTTTDGLRAKALFKDPNVFGPFLVPITLILIEETLQPRLLQGRALWKALLLAILMIGIFLSYSRGAWVNFAVSVAVMLALLALRRGGGRRAAALLVIITLGSVAVAGVVYATGSLDFLQERAAFQSYDNERFAAQREGIRFGEENLLGIGPGQVEVSTTTPSHNIYIRALSEQGFLGLFTIVGFILTTLVLAIRNALLGRDSYGIGSAALLGIWVGLAVESFVIDTLHWRHLWLVAALIWVGTRRRLDSSTGLARDQALAVAKRT
jgi:O-antigen ligase